MKTKTDNIDDYISAFPATVQEKLQQIRETIQKTAPEAIESISYAMPAFKLKGKPLVYFAGYKNHIGFYATPTGHKAFEEELSNYKQGKGSVQFPVDKPMPLALIARITKFRVAEQQLKMQEGE
ncbi:iron chaperone [Pedobacter insulae]|uniref:Uncharacterized conserved protein YdhG, YjbR/CyaY-like superfamily, DUF1801 family n=1 Tax=Pedobacter insulae TaxID=414048 RepID=A0A1I2WKM7_9SPHI|nr:DUF1801 domain-containing protein [Pedobacter insulae]SFH01872.1 Uncharacterized conserved protein YdhG, YjbR/CyaY-like superfamily, DUF1801 family [Pedobacter insulae]